MPRAEARLDESVRGECRGQGELRASFTRLSPGTVGKKMGKDEEQYDQYDDGDEDIPRGKCLFVRYHSTVVYLDRLLFL